MYHYYDKRSGGAIGSTNSVANSSNAGGYGPAMLGSADLLNELRRLKNEGRTTNADLSRLLSLPSSRIAEIFEGKRRIHIDEMKILVEQFELDGAARPVPPPANDDDIAEIVSLDLSLSMGPGTLIEEFIEEEPVRISLRFVQAITRTPSDCLRFVRGIGDSMEPTLRTGDRVMIDINDRQLARSHGIYWVDHFGTHGLKRLRPSGHGKIMVMSDNALIPDFEAEVEDIRIHGRAIWFARDL